MRSLIASGELRAARRFSSIVRGGALSAILAIDARAQVVFNPENGHYYERVLQAGIQWPAANYASKARSHAGLTGHLATITCPAEQSFVNANFGSIVGIWLGGFWGSELNGWRWVTGETWGFTAFHPGQPNNLNSQRAYLMLNPTGLAWYDAWDGDTAVGYIVEYSPDIPVATDGPTMVAANINGSSSFTLLSQPPTEFGATAFPLLRKSGGGSTGGGFAAASVLVTTKLELFAEDNIYFGQPFGAQVMEQNDEGRGNVPDGGSYAGQVNGDYVIKLDRDYRIVNDEFEFEPDAGGQVVDYVGLIAGNYRTSNFQFSISDIYNSRTRAAVLEPLPYPCLRTGVVRRESSSAIAARCAAPLAFDSVRNKSVVLDVSTPPQLWGWNGTWSALSNTGPTKPRSAYAITFDSMRQRVVLFGGRQTTGSQGYFSELWEWDGSAWYDRQQGALKPAPRHGAFFAYDVVRGVSVLIGGRSGTADYARETWDWNGSVWDKRANLPLNWYPYATCYDPSRGGVVALNSDGAIAVFKNNAWQISPTYFPGYMNSAALVFDPRVQKLVLMTSGGGSYVLPHELIGGVWTLMSLRGSDQYSNPGGVAYDLSRQTIVGTFSKGGYGMISELLRASKPTISVSTPTWYGRQGESISLSSVVTSEGSPLVQWHKNGLPLSDIGPVSGSASTTLTISQATMAHAGQYSASATDECGQSVSASIHLTVGACAGDFNGDGMVEDADFLTFVEGYNLLICSDSSMPGGCPADLNRDGLVDDLDFQAFITPYDQLECAP